MPNINLIIKRMTWTTRTTSLTDIICKVHDIQVKGYDDIGKPINEIMTFGGDILICLDSPEPIDKINSIKHEDYQYLTINDVRYKIVNVDDSYTASFIYEISKKLHMTEEDAKQEVKKALIDYLIEHIK